MTKQWLTKHETQLMSGSFGHLVSRKFVECYSGQKEEVKEHGLWMWHPGWDRGKQEELWGVCQARGPRSGDTLQGLLAIFRERKKKGMTCELLVDARPRTHRGLFTLKFWVSYFYKPTYDIEMQWGLIRWSVEGLLSIRWIFFWETNPPFPVLDPVCSALFL